ncbi:MAG TPA: DNA polymerase I [Solirubrobacteraceae bacterium]|nr:DNA polymerase I [Solirubrobacteraceae bacterium]
MAANGHDELFLIDGNSLAYRAFFALPESIATSTGFPTNTIFGFASMLVKLLTEYGSKPTIVVWDAGSSGRKEVSADYKATRRSRPDLLKEQWPHLEPLVDAFGYRNIAVEGFEADDVIATIADRARDAGVPVMVVTGDRDAFQIIDPESRVKVMATGRGITDTKIYDHQAVIDRYGIAPELIPDFYGLKGDTSDNIPGVPGIGDKTAADLLQRFGSLEEVLAHIDDISGAKRKENLTAHADNARLSKVLATIKLDVPVEVDPVAEAAREPDRSRLRDVFREFELRAPLARLEEAFGEGDEAAPAAPAEVTVKARVRAGSPADVAGFERGKEVTIAVVAPETPEGQLVPTDTHWRFGVAAGEHVLVGACDGPQELVAALGDRPVVAHDAKELGVVPPGLTHDTVLAAYLLEPARRGFPFREICEERGLASDVADPAGADAVVLQALAAWQREQLADRGLESLMAEVELPLVRVLRDMEIAGVRLNRDRLAEVDKRVREEIHGLEREIWTLAGEEFVIASPQQLGAVLFEKLGLSRKRRGKTGFSTDARVLQAIRGEHEIVPKIERWRELNQILKTYLDVLPQLTDTESRVHTTFVQAAATTGRLASTNPNMQNVPVRTELGREIRGCFEAAPGNALISADYSQVELRVLANIADEPVLKEIFVRGEDVHTATGSVVFGKDPSELTPMDRSKSKMINYGIVYGLSDYGLADRLNIPREEAKAFIDAYLERFPRVGEFIRTTIESAREHGHVTTLFGRRRQIPELRARNWQVRSLGERLAVNTVIQGTAADIMKLAMIRVHRALAESALTTRMILTIHDELLFEGPPEEADAVKELVEREMIAPWDDRTPPLAVDAGAGQTWLEAK